MMDLLRIDWLPALLDQVMETRQTVHSPIVNVQVLEDEKELMYGGSSEVPITTSTNTTSKDHSFVIVTPIFETLEQDEEGGGGVGGGGGDIIGVLVGVLEWEMVLADILEDEAVGMVIDIEHTCHDRISFIITNTSEPVFVGHHYPHDESLEYMTERHDLLSGDVDDSSDDRRRRRRRRRSVRG